MIRFACPACRKILKAPDEGAGRKINCPKCGQRLLIPPPVQVQNKTVLGESLPDTSDLLARPPSDREDDMRTPNENRDACRSRPVLRNWGLVLLCLGVLLVLFFAVIYDTTVLEYPGTENWDNPPRVYNMGRMQNRQIGIWIGLGSAAGGIAMIIAGRPKPRS